MKAGRVTKVFPARLIIRIYTATLLLLIFLIIGTFDYDIVKQ